MKIKLLKARFLLTKRLMTFIMRVFIFFLCTATFSLSPLNSLSQEKVVIDQDQLVSVDKVFKIIKRQTNYRFIYPKKAFKDAPMVHLKRGEITVEDLLEQSLSNKNLGFELTKNNTIVINKNIKTNKIDKLQEFTVNGNITDVNGSPLPGVTIIVKGTNRGTTTNFDGKYSIKATSTDVIVFSYVGFLTQEIVVGNNETINVVMKEDASELDEVVVVGYGTQKKENLTGAVSAIGSKEIEQRPITSASVALQGTTSGVFINQNSGQPGRNNVSIRIRGVGTLNNTNPLILVDGIEAPFDNINPDDIENISVLKDAASAAIYGSRAANGVVLVTTKRGSGIEGVQFNYNGFYGFSEGIRFPEMVTNSAQFAELWNEAITNFGGAPRYSDNEITNFRENGPNTDWLGALFETGSIQQHNFSVSGSNKNTNYRFSFGLMNDDGIVPKAKFKRYNYRLNLDSQINDKLKIGTSISLIRGDRESHQENLTPLGDGGPIAQAARSIPLDRIYNDDGILVRPQYGFSWVFTNIVAGNYNSISNEVLGNAYLEYEVLEGLKIKGTAAINHREFNDTQFNQTIDLVDPITDELLDVQTSGRFLFRNAFKQQNLTYWLQSTYEKSVGKSNFKVLVGYNQETSVWNAFNTSRSDFLSNNIRVLSAGDPSTAVNNEDASEWALQSYFGRINYDFDGKYLLEANFRRDGSSRFANDKWGSYPAFSAGWIVSKESFFNVPFINFLKLRGSWGQLGNQNIGDFAFARQLSLTQSYSFNGELAAGVGQTSLGNPDLTWEATTTSNIGINLGMFNNKLQIEADYFTRTTDDILFDIPISSITGFNSQIQNSAKVENKGFEVAVNYRNQLGDFDIAIGGNMTYVEDEVLELNKFLGPDEENRSINGRFILEPGSSLNAFYGFQVNGIFRDQAQFDNAPDHTGLNPNWGVGDLEYADLDGDGVITNEDRTVIGRRNPKLLYGGNISIKYKGLELFAIIQGAAKFQSYAGGEISQPFHNSAQLNTRWLDRWTPNNPNASMPRLYFSDGPSSTGTNSFWLLNRSYMRLKNVQLSYTFPKSVFDKTPVKSMKVFVNGQNLLTITDFPFFDPERPEGLERGGQGFPNLRVISAGLDIKF